MRKTEGERGCPHRCSLGRRSPRSPFSYSPSHSQSPPPATCSPWYPAPSPRAHSRVRRGLSRSSSSERCAGGRSRWAQQVGVLVAPCAPPRPQPHADGHLISPCKFFSCYSEEFTRTFWRGSSELARASSRREHSGKGTRPVYTLMLKCASAYSRRRQRPDTL